MKQQRALVIFSPHIPPNNREYFAQFDLIVAPESLREKFEAYGCTCIALETLVDPGSIYEASELAEELSKLELPDGTRVTKSFVYEGYELWWANYPNLYTRFCLPFTQYRKLLERVRAFEEIHFSEPPFMSLFGCYLGAYGCKAIVVPGSTKGAPSMLPFGILVQMFLTILFLPPLVLMRKKTLVSTGDKFETARDHDFRMRFIYESLREKKLPFVESIRSLESARKILQHALVRKRPVIYSEAVTFMGRFISAFTGGHRRALRTYGPQVYASLPDPDTRFKLTIATQYLLTAYDDVASIRITKWILRVIGVRAAIIPATTERNFHTVLGCKLNGIPTVGILHGVASRHYNLYEFTPSFDGPKRISVDRYGVWSEWWKQYFTKYSKAYGPEQVFVSGPMRPMQKRAADSHGAAIHAGTEQTLKVLFVSEVVAIPTEVVPYLDALMQAPDLSVFIKFRATHDSFEAWLKDNRPDILEKLGTGRVLKGSMHEAIEVCDITVGCQSTGVIEATLQDKPFVYFNTQKWGDYFDMRSFDTRYHFFAENPGELIECVRGGRSIPVEVLRDLQQKFFGDPYKNGSAWVVDEISKLITSP